MGRTGRKRAGRIVVLVTEGAEEQKYNQSLYNKKAINRAISDKERLETCMFADAPRMVPRGLDPVCQVMRMQQSEWKQNKIGSKAGGGTFRKMSKYDLFSVNCGFLTEAESERYKKLPPLPRDKSKSLQEPREMWAAGPGDDEDTDHKTFDLREYSMWQSDSQNRLICNNMLTSSSFVFSSGGSSAVEPCPTHSITFSLWEETKMI